MNPTRRMILSATRAAAAFGIAGPILFERAAFAQASPSAPSGVPEPGQGSGFRRFNVGSIEVTMLYDGIWRKPHDPTFIKNASVEETRDAFVKAGQTGEYVPIPLTVAVLKLGDRYVMVDSGSGAGQWQPTAGFLAANMAAAGIDATRISTILISHFHPDHIFGLMAKGTNAPIFPNAELVVAAREYAWWTEPGRVDKLPDARKALGQRINTVFPTWKTFRLVDKDGEVLPGISLVDAPGHTPGHAAYHVASGNDQLMLSNDVAYLPALLGPHPDWQGTYDQDSPLAVTSRRRILDRVIADRMMIAGAHFPFSGTGRFEKDGAGYTFTPVAL